MLVAEESSETLAAIQRALASEPVKIFTATTRDAAWELFQPAHPRIVMADYALSGNSGLALMDRCVAADPGVDFVLLADSAHSEVALEAIRRGAYDCLYKPLDIGKLRDCVRTLVGQA